MEDPRISRMYLAMIGRGMRGLGEKVRRAMRSTVTWILLLILILIGVGLVRYEHGRGNLHRLKATLGAAPPTNSAPHPGGQDPIILKRKQNSATEPEFLSATLLPGRGMNVLQIRAFVPGKGEIALLESPSLDQADAAMTGMDQDMNGQESLLMGGAIEVPWANQISGALLSDNTTVLTSWNGQTLTLPSNWPQNPNASTPTAMGGLLLRRSSDSSKVTDQSDGQTADVVFHAGDFDGHWPSKTNVETNFQLEAHKITLTITAKNVGTAPEPMGIGWMPRFLIPSGQRSQAILQLPRAMHAEAKSGNLGLPNGKIEPVTGTRYDFTAGKALGSMDLNDGFVQLNGGGSTIGLQSELIDPADRYGLRITLRSSTIKAFHIYAPVNQNFVSIAPQTNIDDPFSRDWDRRQDTGVVTLLPGATLEWKIDLELFQPEKKGAS